MKTKVLAALLFLSLLWAGSVSYLYWKLKNNPRVIAITTEVGKESLQNVQLSEMEKVTFLRQYLDRYFNFDSNNFWQSQTSLAFLMSPQLGETRVREVSRLREKIQQKNLSQSGQLKWLRQKQDGSFAAQVYIQVQEGGESSEGRQKKELYTSLTLKLQNTERTLENPWGILVQEMTVNSSSANATVVSKDIRVQTSATTLLTFPCAIENIENPAERNLQIKITTLNVSELQMTPQKELTYPTELVAWCKDTEYHLQLVKADSERELFVAIPTSLGQARAKEAGIPRPRKKDVYEKTIENVLGIKVEE